VLAVVGKLGSSRRDDARHSARHRRAAVLIVDDAADVRELYSEYLTAQGFAVVTAQDAATGIDAALRGHPDVIVMDLEMPRVDGVTAIRQLKADRRTRAVPVILLTGYAHKAIDRGALEAGATAFLTKPCLPEDLEHHVRQLVAQSRLRNAA
jgi:two-component system, cell cycle response regulator DivK